MTYSDQAIQYVIDFYVQPAARSGEPLVRVRAGDVHKALRWNNRVPSVCQALSSKRFLEENQLELVEKHGPPSGLGMNMVYTYRLKSERPHKLSKPNGLEEMWGKGKEMFRRLGGGEAWLKAERENFYSAGQEEERQIRKKA
jgi:hypothetical protein